MEILEKNIKKNPLLHREEINLKIRANKISKEEVKEIIEKNFNVKKDLVVINKIISRFGENVWNVDAFIYENEKYLRIFYGKNEKEKKEQKTE